eukprot:m.18374 g.18374  ORF g.18374 m.18374 type:complete len:573 (+) comp5309_c0_seq2:589-2307(+)
MRLKSGVSWSTRSSFCVAAIPLLSAFTLFSEDAASPQGSTPASIVPAGWRSFTVDVTFVFLGSTSGSSVGGAFASRFFPRGISKQPSAKFRRSRNQGLLGRNIVVLGAEVQWLGEEAAGGNLTRPGFVPCRKRVRRSTIPVNCTDQPLHFLFCTIFHQMDHVISLGQRRPRSVCALLGALVAAHVASPISAVCLELWDQALCHPGNLTLLPQTAGDLSPACLDGSPYGVYFRPSPTRSSAWTVFLQGGGWCYDESDCLSRSHTVLGSSKEWPATSGCNCLNLKPEGALDDSCNCLFLPYGDGASFSGFRPNPWPVPNSNATLTFRGIKNLDAALDWAFSHTDLAEATDFVLSGGSAGGLSTFLHADRVATRMRAGAPKLANGPNKIRAAPFTGFFLDHADFAHDAKNYTGRMEYVYAMQNMSFGSDGALAAACEAAHPETPGLCFMSPHMASTITTPFFMFNSRFDAWQLSNINQAGWATPAEKAAVIQYGSDFLEQWSAVVRPPNGAMITTCICHACNWTDYVLAGKSSFGHYADWTFRTTTGNASLHVDFRAPNGGGTMDGPFAHCAPFS